MLTKSSIYIKILVFSGLLILNFGALAIGGLLMGGSPASNEWYISLNKAPWTPPGWVFGFAWTFIMICFTFYIYNVINIKKSLKFTLLLYILQWVLNVLWNPLFFKYHLTILALITILLLFAVLLVMVFQVKTRQKHLFYILPYLLWLLIAISLNFYVVAYN